MRTFLKLSTVNLLVTIMLITKCVQNGDQHIEYTHYTCVEKTGALYQRHQAFHEPHPRLQVSWREVFFCQELVSRKLGFWYAPTKRNPEASDQESEVAIQLDLILARSVTSSGTGVTYTRLLICPHNKKSRGVRSGDRGGLATGPHTGEKCHFVRNWCHVH